MEERIEIRFGSEGGRPSVGVHYIAATPEWGPGDALVASEVGLHGLALSVLEQRLQQGLPVPPEILALVNARTFEQLGGF